MLQLAQQDLTDPCTFYKSLLQADGMVGAHDRLLLDASMISMLHEQRRSLDNNHVDNFVY